MTLHKFMNHTESLKISNGDIVHHSISDLAINPKNENKVYASVHLNGEHFEKKFDSLDSFYNNINKSNNSLVDLLKSDTAKLKKNNNIKRNSKRNSKRNNKYKKHKITLKKQKRKQTRKKIKN